MPGLEPADPGLNCGSNAASGTVSECHRASLRAQFGEDDCVHELGVLALQIRFCHPTGDRAGPSDVDRYRSSLTRLHQLAQWLEADR
jgi:hypothetical protein